jgi:uncharacterized protein YkwD
MNLLPLKRVFCWAALLVAALASALPAADRPAHPELLFVMPAKGFFAIADLDRPIDPQRLDAVLLSAALFHETNEHRRLYSRPRLVHSAQLDRAAQIHADSMVKHDFIAHENPKEPELATLQQRVKKAGLVQPGYLAENIATRFGIQYRAGTPVFRVERNGEPGFSYRADGPLIPRHSYRSLAAAVLEDWMASPAHWENIRSEKPESLGAACAAQQDERGMVTLVCVQVFAAP